MICGLLRETWVRNLLIVWLIKDFTAAVQSKDNGQTFARQLI
jgi:hypothetical protein